jgi:phage terminase large subunit-like protein
MSKNHPAEKYASDIILGKIPACRFTKLACERYFSDLDVSIEKGWKFDRSAPERVIKFFHKILKHYQDEWAGKPFILEPWQQFIIWNLYGWKNSDGSRRFTYVSVFVPRKNGKTELAAGCALYGMGFDGTQAAEVYSTATDKDQAKIAWEKSKRMVMQSSVLLDYIQPMANAIYGERFASTFKPWSSDSGKKDGYNPSFAIVDEYHAHRDNSMMDVIKSGLGGRREPIVFMITTAGFNTQSPCYKHQIVCQDILEGKKHQDNLFTIIYSTDTEDDWNDRQSWIKANPSWFAIPTIQRQIEEAYLDAVNSKDPVNFKTKNLNVWTRAAETWIQDSDYMACFENYTEIDLTGETCFGGLDLSDSYDISSLSLYFPESNKLLRYFFIPEEKINEKGYADDVNYQEWVDDGWLTVTPGNVIDYSYIRYTITGYHISDGSVSWSNESITEKFNLVQVAFDRWGATQIMIQLTDDGVEMLKHGQGYADMNNPTKQYKRMIVGKELKHNGNPVSRWMLGNVVIQRDPAGNEKPAKNESKGKIDGVVSDIMAINAALRYYEENPYLSNTITTL